MTRTLRRNFIYNLIRNSRSYFRSISVHFLLYKEINSIVFFIHPIFSFFMRLFIWSVGPKRFKIRLTMCSSESSVTSLLCWNLCFQIFRLGSVGNLKCRKNSKVVYNILWKEKYKILRYIPHTNTGIKQFAFLTILFMHIILPNT